MRTLSDRALGAARRIAERAGELLLRGRGGKWGIRYKAGRGNLVTDMDRASEELIVREIRREFPDHQVVAEESGRHGAPAEGRWYVDPLDGTTNYAHGLPLYCVSIGFEWRGKVAAGVVYHPPTRDLWSAQSGKGAYRNRRRLHVSKTRRLDEALLCTGFPYAMTPKMRHLRSFRAFLGRTRAIRRLGAAALDLCWTAAGVFDGFWESGLAPWDVAAGSLLCLEAGAKVSDFSGRPTDLHRREILVANPAIHPLMLAVLRPHHQKSSDTF